MDANLIRYTCFLRDDGHSIAALMVPSDTGEYVKFADVMESLSKSPDKQSVPLFSPEPNLGPREPTEAIRIRVEIKKLSRLKEMARTNCRTRAGEIRLAIDRYLKCQKSTSTIASKSDTNGTVGVETVRD